MPRKTVVAISGQAFHINGRPTYEGRTFSGMKIEGLLMNSRMVQGIFDDRNAETRDLWKYPDGPWDAQRNTREFLAAMPEWRRHGLLAFTINLQGGSPQGYSAKQPWHNSAFEADGSLRADYLARLERILDKADDLGMVAILGYFYFGQDERLKDEAAVIKGVETATDWLLAKGYTNVLVEINNECNVQKYDHAILKPNRVQELIELVKKRSAGKGKTPAGRLLASASMGGGAIPPENLVAAADFLLLHGNGVGEPDRIRKMVETCRGLKAYRGQPILFNEDDHFDFDQPDNNMIAAISKYASWGYFDFRMKGEGYDEGYQSVPANWGLSSARKRGFFGLLAKMTGAGAGARGTTGAAGTGGATTPGTGPLSREPTASAPASGSRLNSAAGARGPTGARGLTGAGGATAPAAAPVSVETPALRVSLAPDTGACQIADSSGGVLWRPAPGRPRFGQVLLKIDGRTTSADLGPCDVKRAGNALEATFRPLADKPDLWLRVRIAPTKDARGLDFSYEAADPTVVESIRLLDNILWTTDAEQGAVVVPVREGLLIPADSGVAFTHSFDTYAYEGCHMQMVGILKGGAAALVTWDDCYVAADVRSMLTGEPSTAGQAGRGTPDAAAPPARQTVHVALVLRKSARACRVTFLGKGDCHTIARAYRDVARQRGWVVTWDEKLRGHPDRAGYLGAVNFKLWSTLSRKMSDDSTQEVSVKVNWTFDEAAQIAEHLKNDLKLDRVLFIMGGWIHRGYDNQHPDILPTAPECGGDEAFSTACRRIRSLGYLLSLHDNYQDMYRDAPSYDPSYIMKNADGSLHKGGHWAGGVCYLTCSQRAVDLAKRPQNLPAVKKLSDADSYFIDTTYAAGLQECFDPKHPLTRADDLKWKQALSDYAREVFGSFGSECGREWAIPHADFFEGLTGVSGTFYHNKGLPAALGAVPLPLFEMVYRDCIAMYGKYGYDIYQAAPYVLWHVSIGRPLNYHSVPPHLYWKGWTGQAKPAAVAPKAAQAKAVGPRQIEITYHWAVEEPPTTEWSIFVHFTDPAGKDIRFQNDHAARGGMTAWKPGDVADGPYTVTVPEGLNGAFDVRVGFYAKPSLGRIGLLGESDNERRYTVGRLKVAGDKVAFTPVTPRPAAAAGDAALFTRSDGGWAEGLHPMDVFVKNTYEVLSPLNELTARVLLTRCEFLTPDRTVRRTVFGDGASRTEVIVNLGAAEFKAPSQAGGEVVLPPLGFLVESPRFLAFCASRFGGLSYSAPALFTVRGLDGKPIAEAGQVRIYHGFGDPRLRLAGKEHRVEKESTE